MATEPKYDVIVVGSGPAGGTAAYWLGQAGKRVLVLEKEKLPRYKPCGGAVPPSVFTRFPFDFEPVVERTVRRTRYRFCDGRESVMDYPDHPMAMVMRDRFDLHILEQARADVRDGCRITSVNQDEEGVDAISDTGASFRGRYLVGADGANSHVARAVGLRRQKFVGGAIEVEIDAQSSLLQPDEETAVFLFGSPSGGYQWIFPKATHLSVGIGAFSAAGSGLRETFRADMESMGITVDGANHRGHPLPIYCRHEALHSGRVLLVGDAAAMMDPLLGEGIRHAVDSGKLAADAILQEQPARYTGRVHRAIGDDLLWGLRWARPFYSFPEASFELGVRNPLIATEFLRLFAGDTTYRKMALRAPELMIRGIGHRLPVTQEC